MKAFMHQVEKQWRSQIGVKDVGGTGNGKVQTPDPTMFLRKQKDVTETEMEGLASNRRENSDPGTGDGASGRFRRPADAPRVERLL